MDGITRQRALMALIGAFAGISLYALSEVLERHMLNDRAALALTAFAATFFTALLAMAGPLSIRRAALGAVGVAIAVALLLAWASLRFETVEAAFGSPILLLAGFVLALVPLPFFIAANGPGWRNYPALFTHAWTIVVRYASAWLFVGVVWAVIFLSDTLLEIVGLTIIGDLIDIDPMPWLITGLALGLGLAVVTEMADLVSPYLILRLLRLLLPVVLLVMVVFIAALPFKGLTGLFGTLSAAATLLVMAAVAATLVTTAIDQSDAGASAGPLMRRATQALALILPVPAVLGAWAVWLRVDQYGWTPDRVFAALVAALALGYGLLYAGAVLRGRGWRRHIRQGNVSMALVLIAVSATLLTPILNPERIAAASQLARFRDGRTDAATLDVAGLESWGRAGAGALAELHALAQQPGQQALAARLAGRLAPDGSVLPTDFAALHAALRAELPLQPGDATVARDRILAALDPAEVGLWLEACRSPLPDGNPGCVMVIGDFRPQAEGLEAIVVLRDASGYTRYDGLGVAGGLLQRQTVTGIQGYPPYGEAGIALIRAMQTAVPAVTPAPLNQLAVGDLGLILMP